MLPTAGAALNNAAAYLCLSAQALSLVALMTFIYLRGRPQR
jgi:hypothetical protein